MARYAHQLESLGGSIEETDAISIMWSKDDQSVRSYGGSLNSQSVLIWPDMLTNSKDLADVSKIPTPSTLHGAKTTNPFGATTAPTNFLSMAIWSAMLNNISADVVPINFTSMPLGLRS